MNYIPKPVDTSKIELPEQIEAILEDLARNTHEIWAEGRRREGWVYGEALNAAEKKHPSFVPYEQLPESEKEYDRNTAAQSIKLLLHYGFKITGQE